MGKVGLIALAGAAVLAAGAAPPRRSRPAAAPPPPPTVGPITGPVAEYWISADTASGFGAGLAGGARPSMGKIMGMMSGRGGGVQRTVTLQLGSTQRPTGAPFADHFTPASLGVGASLPLVTPVHAPSEPTRTEPAEPGSPESYQRPRGRLLIYWGCGERAGPGQPVVFDFSTIGTGAPLPDIGSPLRVNVERPPSEARSATYGHWPNERRRVNVPPTGSLVGAHDVRGTYSPEMRFDVGPQTDFMAPLDLAVAGPTPGGGRRVTWSSSAAATGYSLMLIGAQAAGRSAAGGPDMVFWSSSSVKPGIFGAGLADYLAPAEVARLVRERAVLPPGSTECVIPAEVAQASPMGLVSAIGYGPEQVWTDPPRPASGPWPISWRAKVRVKTTAAVLLGMPGPGASPARPPPSNADRARDLLKSFRPF